MATKAACIKLSLQPYNQQRLVNLCGQCNEHIHQLETYFDVKIHQRSNSFRILGNPKSSEAASQLIDRLYQETLHEPLLTPAKIYLFLNENHIHSQKTIEKPTMTEPVIVKTKRATIKPHGENQMAYVQNMQTHDINFAIGPAGTGKTYLAVACAVEALEKGQVQRLVLVRPAVEAGEKLGFLPGDMADKVLPYLRPLYDALYEMMGVDQVTKLTEQDIIEIAPLAFMRGRTLSDAFVILDEGQNTTVDQMKMFLTRIGFGSTAIITGDVTQIDLSKGTKSGLIQATQVLKDIEGISFNYFAAEDAVRHPLVQSIIQAYSRFENKL